MSKPHNASADSLNELLESNENICKKLQVLDHWSKDQPLISEATASIRVTKGFRNFLATQLKAVQEALDALESTLKPFFFGKGIDSLPNEILSMIFAYYKEKKTWSLVSRRFRDIVLSTPNVWSTISNYNTDDVSVVNELLKRSKMSKLKLHLPLGGFPARENGEEWGFSSLNILDALLPHKDRWEVFQADISFKNSDLWKDIGFSFADIEKRLLGIHLPCLTEIRLEYLEYQYHALAEPNPAIHFYSSFLVPQLRTLAVENFIPIPFFVTPPLTRFEIGLDEESYGLCAIRDLTLFLGSIPTMETVILQLLCFATELDEELTTQQLPSLKYMEIMVDTMTSDWYFPLRRSLITPVLSEFRLVILGEAPEGLTLDCLERTFCHEYVALEKFTLDLNHASMESNPNWHSDKYHFPFDKMPNLRELCITSPNMQPIAHMSNDAGRFPALRSIKLIGEGTDWEDFLSFIAMRLRGQGDMEHLEVLEVDNPSLTSYQRKRLQAVIEEREIKWVSWFWDRRNLKD